MALIQWFSDTTFRRLLRNAGLLVSGTAIGGALGLAAMLLAARVLGPAEFGVVAVIVTYIGIVDRFFNFQTWQALIRFGASALGAGDETALRRLVKVCTLLDAGSAALGAIIAALFAGFTARVLGLSAVAGDYMALYAVVIATNLVGAPTAILRLYNRFDLLALQSALGGAINLVGVIACWSLGGGLGGVLLALAAGKIVGDLFLLAAGWRTLARKGVHGVWATPIGRIRATEPGLVGFVIWTNIESSVKILREVDVFVVKAMLSVEAVGLYFAARRISNVLFTAIAPFTYAIYPEFAKFVAAGDRRAFLDLFRRSAISVTVVASAAFAVFLVFGGDLLASTLGEEYRPAYLVTALCLFGAVAWAATQPLSPAMFSLGMVRSAFAIHLTVACVYLATLAPLIALAGLGGAGVGYAFLFVFWGVLAVSAVTRRLGRAETQKGVG